MLIYRFPDQPTSTTPDFVRGIREAEWYAQGKYDGHRCLITTGLRLPKETKAGGLRLFGRHRDLLSNPKLPPLQSQIAEMGLPDGCVVDSEFVGPRGNHVPGIYIFDCLAWKGKWLDQMPFQDRWQLCCTEIASYIVPKSNIHLAETMESGFLAYLQQLALAWVNGGCQMDLFEGIVLKRRTGTMKLGFNSGMNSGHLFKIRFRDIRDARNINSIINS